MFVAAPRLIAKVSTTTTPVAMSVPLFVTVIRKFTVSPTVKVPDVVKALMMETSAFLGGACTVI